MVKFRTITGIDHTKCVYTDTRFSCIFILNVSIFNSHLDISHNLHVRAHVRAAALEKI